MNLSSVVAVMAYQIRHLATSTTRPSTSTRSSSLVATRLASSSPLVSVLPLRLLAPLAFPPPSPRSSRAPPLPPPPPPRCPRPRASRPVPPRLVSSSRPSRRHAWLLCLSLPLAACRPRGDPALSGTPWPRAAAAGCLLKCAKNRGRRPLAALLLGTSSRVSWDRYGSVSSRC